MHFQSLETPETETRKGVHGKASGAVFDTVTQGMGVGKSTEATHGSVQDGHR